MPNPPKYDTNKLNSSNQFLCSLGSTASVPRLDLDGKKTKKTQDAYYSTSRTNVPFEILNTGNVEVLSNYLANHGDSLNSKEKNHLSERIDVMMYLDELGKFYYENERKSVGKMEVNSKGQKVLPGIVLDRKQDTNNGCWSCAFSMLLKGRGIQLDQKVIRRYRPEIVEGHEIKSPKQTDTINSDMMSEIYQHYGLVNKICPNTKMCKMNSKGGEFGASRDELKNQIISALRDKNAPVAFCSGVHWTTIVGVSDDGNNFYVVNSMNKEGGVIDTISAAEYLDHPNGEFVWLEDIVLDKDGRSSSIPEKHFTVDKASGAVVAKPTRLEDDDVSDIDEHGNRITDSKTHMEYFIPSMIRDYTRSYEEQKKQADEYILNKVGPVKPEKKEPTYTMASDYSYEAVIRNLNERVETNLFSDRKSFMRDKGFFTQRQIDAMTPDEANMYYDYYKAHPDIKEMPKLELKKKDEQKAAKKPAEKSAENDTGFSIFDEDVKEEKAPEAKPAEKKVEPAKEEKPSEKKPEKEKAPEQKKKVDDLLKERFSRNTTKAPKGIDPDLVLTDEEIKFIYGDQAAEKTKSEKTEPEKKPEAEKKPETEPSQKAEKKASPKIETPLNAKTERNARTEDTAEQERAAFEKLGKALKKAQTFTNSKQYYFITEKIQALGNEDFTKNMTREQRTAVMAMTASMIKDYIAHKAADGVKPNVFKKLAAVEATSRYLDEKLQPYRGQELAVGDKTIIVDPVPLSLQAQYKDASYAAKTNYDRTIKLEPMGEKLNAITDPDMKEMAKHTNECMNKIMLNSFENGGTNFKEINAMRHTFADEKFIKGELSAKKETKAPEKKQEPKVAK